MTSTHFNYHYAFPKQRHVRAIFKGIPDDFELFRQEFFKCSNLRFKSFALKWKTLKMLSIFGDRVSVSELVEVTEGIIHYCKGYLFAQNLHCSLFGMYLLYAIYFKQLIGNMRSKIRLTLQELRDLNGIIVEMGDASDYEDAIQAWCQLHYAGAFQYVVTEHEAGIDYGFRKYYQKDIKHEAGEGFASTPFESTLLDEFQELYQDYVDQKKEAFGESESDAFVNESNFVDTVQKLLLKLTDISIDATGEDAPECKDEALANAIGERRVALKRKAYKARKRTHSTLNEETEAAGIEPETSTGSGRQRRQLFDRKDVP